jgi:hypothetical protein
MMHMNKMKVADKFEAVRALLRGEVVENFTLEDAQNFLTERKEIAMRKNASNGERKPTKEQVENMGIKATIVEVLGALGTAVSITDLQKADERLVPYSNQKMGSLLTQLIKDKQVVRTEAKGKPYYSLPTEE